MGLLIDLHVHTRRYSACSQVNPARLIARAVKAGMHGVVIMEHHRQWSQEELKNLVESSGHPGFLLLAGFEYTSARGDILIYGLEPGHVALFEPGRPPREALKRATDLGGCCIAAHPTRASLGFDEDILTLPFAAIEVASMNMKPHEQRLAAKIAEATGAGTVAASDAHHVADVGRYATEFLEPIHSMRELQDCLRRGRFRLAGSLTGANAEK